MRPSHRLASRMTATLALAGLLLIAAAPAATADGAVVTRGDFAAFATSSDAAIGGSTVMVRTADGRTIVGVHLVGLAADTAYGAHVHLQPCSVGNAGGHYKLDPAGPGAPPNEIWPAFTTNAAGIGSGRATADWTAGPTAVSVVVHAPGGAKIACADLS